MNAHTTFGCVGSTIRLASGNYLDLAAPDPNAITLRDIVCALSKVCRFGGQIDDFYSVAEHSVACAELAVARGLPRHVQFACLMHDATEAFLGDVVKPLKILIDPLYGPLESAMEAAICHRFAVDLDGTAEHWKLIDRIMLIAEKKALTTNDRVIWNGEGEIEQIDYKPRCWQPREAALAFEVMFMKVSCS